MQYFSVPGCSKSLSSMALGTQDFTLKGKEQWFRLMDEYVKQGGCIIDTARMYGNFEAEKVIGEWLRLNPEMLSRVFIVTKGCLFDTTSSLKSKGWSGKPLSRAQILNDLEESLKDLDIPKVDAFLLHRDAENAPIPELFDTLHELRLEQKIDCYGVSNWTQDRTRQANEYCKSKGYAPIAINSPAFSVPHVTESQYAGCLHATPEYIKWNVDQGIIPLCWAPNATGFMSGRITKTETGKIQTDMSLDGAFKRTYFSPTNWLRLAVARRMAEEKKASVSQIALRFVMSFSGQVPVIPILGCHRIETLDDCVKAMDGVLTKEEQEALLVEEK
ncbi:putative Aldo/keto reductase [Blattamonas nauphoetae]|uniref:Aldo/keto reductase n=1 Tax=Blattamonas nauphoetae TaxID=2049346 RepID=A0ABQ9WSG6_9EUKA|nr:putative Aldo/keto reductase [Blattamonas nauphoetae]